jgi:gag-polyprotein putative aspartyl protease/Aspartyl protease
MAHRVNVVNFARCFCTMLAMFVGVTLAHAETEPNSPDLVATIAARTDMAMRMTVPVTIEGRGPYQFVVDTGSDRTVVSRELATLLKLAAGDSVTMHSMTGVAQQTTVTVPSLTLAGQTTFAINAPALQQDYLGGHGLLGIDTLKGRRVVMDFVKRTLSVLRAGEREAYDPDTIVVTARSKYGQLVLVDADVDGTPITVIIDSGAETTVGNAPLRALLSKRNKRMQFFKTELVDVTGGRLGAEYASVGRIRLAGLTIENAVIAFADAHPFKRYGLLNKPAMLLGMDTLRSFRRVSVDFAQRKVRFLPPGTLG